MRGFSNFFFLEGYILKEQTVFSSNGIGGSGGGSSSYSSSSVV